MNISKQEIQSRIDALTYPVTPKELLKHAILTIGLGLDLTNIISVFNAVEADTNANTSEADLIALNSASVTLGITQKGLDSQVNDFRLFDENDQSIKRVLPDGSEWLQCGYVETDIEKYPDAEVFYSGLTLHGYDGVYTASNLPTDRTPDFKHTLNRLEEKVWVVSTNRKVVTEYDMDLVATGRSIDITSYNDIIYSIQNIVWNPNTNKLEFFCGRVVQSVNMDGTNIVFKEISFHDYRKNIDNEVNTHINNSGIVFYRNGLLNYSWCRTNYFEIATYDENYNLVEYSKQNPLQTNTQYVFNNGVYLDYSDRILFIGHYYASNQPNRSTSLIYDFKTNKKLYHSNTSILDLVKDANDDVIPQGVNFYNPFTKMVYIYNKNYMYGHQESNLVYDTTSKYLFTNYNNPKTCLTKYVLMQDKLVVITQDKTFQVYDYKLNYNNNIQLEYENTTGLSTVGTVNDYAVINNRLWLVDYTSQELKEVDITGELVGSPIVLNQSEGQTNQRNISSDGNHLYVWTYGSGGNKGAALYDENGTYVRFQPSNINTNSSVSYYRGSWWIGSHSNFVKSFSHDLSRELHKSISLQATHAINTINIIEDLEIVSFKHSSSNVNSFQLINKQSYTFVGSNDTQVNAKSGSTQGNIPLSNLQYKRIK